MKITRVKLKNWKNFVNVNVKLCDRTFIVGPNASGKSNFLDVFRFLMDVSRGHLQDAVSNRGGMRAIRSLSTAKNTGAAVDLEMKNGDDRWKYSLEINNKPGKDEVYVIKEIVKKNNETLAERPDSDDKKNDIRLTQTYLEQVSANIGFREIVDYFQSFDYLHIVPQVVRYSEGFNGPGKWDAFGANFLKIIADTPREIRNSRFEMIENILQKAIPRLKKLQMVTDKLGKPHLSILYENWRYKSDRLLEDRFSDGTLRLIGMIWILMANRSLLLLEEPELSLHQGIVERLPAMMYRVLKENKSQVLVSTHSADLLSDRSIGGEEVLLLIPGKEDTKMLSAAGDAQIRALLEGGMTAADAIIPATSPEVFKHMDLF